jgi:tetratricopeptide (TPR) repeat protein
LIPGAAVIALSAAYLGAAAGWSLAAPIIGIGVLLILAPIRALPNQALLIGLAGLVVCALLGFLPGFWFGPSEWYIHLRQTIPSLALTLSVQPIQTLLSLGLFLASVLFGAWSIQWRPSNRIAGLQMLVAGIAILAGIALTSDLLRLPVPFWHPSQGFGPFSNRNQTGTLMGLGAIIALGLAVSELRRKGWSSCLWLAALALCLTALLRSNSRASLCLFLAGFIVWFVCRFGTTIRAVALGGGVILLITTVTLLLGEKVVGRLGEFLTDGVGLRWSIYQDTAHLIAAAPLGGVGLGNFAAIFPLFRDTSLNAMRVIHPESDWLWLISETGIGSLLFCTIVIANLVSQPAKPAETRERDVLLAGFLGVLAFLFSTFFDTPAHRLGTTLPALFVLGMCTCPKLLFRGAWWVSWSSRATGIALIVLAFSLLRTSSIVNPPLQEFAKGDWHAVEAKMDQALRMMPLDWSFRLIRGSANVRLGNWVKALSDFRAACILEPKLAVVPFDEGCAWLGINSKLTTAAWKEALSRSPADTELYSRMLDKSAPFPEVQKALLRFGDANLDLAVTAMQTSYADQATLDFVESKRSVLTSQQVTALNRAESRRYAGERDYRHAYELGRSVLRQLPFPPRRQISENECRLALIKDPTDYGAAYELCLILRSQDRKPEMLQVLDLVTNQKGCPDYFYVMRGDLLASMGDWFRAWSAISELVADSRHR